MLPPVAEIIIVAIFGLIIGSFLNVVIYRFHTGRSLNDRSHCLSCGTTLKWYELFPVFSYLALRGRCRSCHSYIPYRYALVEILTSAAFVLAYMKALDLVELLLIFTLLSVLVIGLVYDLYHMIIPDEVSYGALILAIGLICWSVASGKTNTFTIIEALTGGVIAFLAYASLWYFSGGRAFGFGDAKLAVSLGALVSLKGVFSLVVLSFWVGAIVSLALMLWQRLVLNIYQKSRGRHRVTMKSEVPFAPFLLAAFIFVYFFEVDALRFIEALYGAF